MNPVEKKNFGWYTRPDGVNKHTYQAGGRLCVERRSGRDSLLASRYMVMLTEWLDRGERGVSRTNGAGDRVRTERVKSQQGGKDSAGDVC